MKKILITLLLCLLPTFIFADVVDFNKTGSISIDLIDDDTSRPISGVSVSIYKIANVSEKNHNLYYEYESDVDCTVDINKLDNENITNEIESCILNKDATATQISDSKGHIEFRNLDLGIYLIKHTDNVSDGYTFNTFLLNIPMVVDNKFEYDINTTPKIELTKLFDITVYKIWNNPKNNNIPSKVTIELIKNDIVIDTVELNKESNWSYTWKDMEMSDLYSVKEINVPKDYKVSYRVENNNVFYVTNTSTLIETGLQLWLIELLSILGVTFILVGYLLNRNYHEKSN